MHLSINFRHYGLWLAIVAVIFSVPLAFLFSVAAETSRSSLLSAENRLSPPDPTVNGRFGGSVAAGDGVLVIGSPGARSPDGVARGAVYVFVWSGSEWIFQTKLTPTEGLINSGFGESVAISDNILVVGAPAEPIGTRGNAGTVYVFELSNEIWQLQQKILPPEPDNSLFFGKAIGIEGDRIAIGASGTYVMGVGTGAAYVYLRGGDIWSMESQLIEPLLNGADQYGTSVDIHAGRVVVGAPFLDPVLGIVTGGASVFVHDGSEWILEQSLLPSGTTDDQFGSAVAIYGTTIAIGSPRGFSPNGATHVGRVDVFNLKKSIWTMTQTLGVVDEFGGLDFGCDLYISENTLVAGEKGANVLGMFRRGAAYAYRFIDGTWEFHTRLFATDGGVNDQFGTSVGVSGNTIFVGAPLNDLEVSSGGGSICISLLIARSGPSRFQRSRTFTDR